MRLNCCQVKEDDQGEGSPCILRLEQQSCGHFDRVSWAQVQDEDHIKNVNAWVPITREETIIAHSTGRSAFDCATRQDKVRYRARRRLAGALSADETKTTQYTVRYSEWSPEECNSEGHIDEDIVSAWLKHTKAVGQPGNSLDLREENEGSQC